VTITAEPTPAVADVLEKALDGERISDDEAVALLRSRDLVAVGRAPTRSGVG
jgi:2-iminoacetate synthase ThiH